MRIKGFVIVPEPETITHIPVPLTGLLPARVAVAVPVVAHNVWFGPALEIVGTFLIVMVILDVEAAQDEKLTDQVSTVVPTVSPVIVELGFVGVVIVPGPETFTQSPLPTTGVFPARFAEPTETQTV